MNSDDKNLVERCIQKDPVAWAEFVHRYSRLIVIAIENRLRRYRVFYSSADVDDIKQNVLASLWKGEKLRSVRQKEKISFWLAIVSGNAAMDFARARSKTREELVPGGPETDQHTEVLEIFNRIPAQAKNSSEALSEREQKMMLGEALGSLDPKERMIMKLYLVHEKDYSDIARILAIPRGTVSSSIRRSKEKLISILNKK